MAIALKGLRIMSVVAVVAVAIYFIIPRLGYGAEAEVEIEIETTKINGVEVTLDHSVSRELSRPFEYVDEHYPFGYLYLVIEVTNVIGNAIGGSHMRLILQDPITSQYKHSFFKRTTVAIPRNADPKKPRDRVSVHVKLPLSRHANVDRLPRVVHVDVDAIEVTAQAADEPMEGNERKTIVMTTKSSQKRVPIAVTEGYDSLELSVEHFGNYFHAKHSQHLQRTKRATSFNVLFFGILGSGKSTEINTIFSALGDRIHRIAETGGGLRHRTQKFAQYRVNNVIQGLGDITINLFDTWGLQDGKWDSSRLFRTIVKGELPEGHLIHVPIDNTIDEGHKSKNENNGQWEDKPSVKRIHAVLLFLPVDSAFDGHYVQMVLDTIEAAQKLDINPTIVATMSQGKTEDQLQEIVSEMRETFKCPIFVNKVYLEDMHEKVFEVDQNAFSLLDTALRAASDHLSKKHAVEDIVNVDAKETHDWHLIFNITQDQFVGWCVGAICVLLSIIAWGVLKKKKEENKEKKIEKQPRRNGSDCQSSIETTERDKDSGDSFRVAEVYVGKDTAADSNAFKNSKI